MRRTFWFLIVLIVGYYGYEACLLYSKLSPLVYVENGKLSELAQRVTPVPLDMVGESSIENPWKFCREGDSLYFISENIVYHFNDRGEFLSQITSPENMLVADYLVDTDNKQLIVFGNEEDVFYYTLQGEFKKRIRFPKDEGYSCLRSVAYHRNRLWVAKDIARNGRDIEKVVMEYDTDFTLLNTFPLEMATTCYHPDLFTCMHPQFSVAPDTEELYVYSSAGKPDYLLRDTLVVRQQRLVHPVSQNSIVQVYPFRIGSRFYVSSQHTVDGVDSYFYCFDDKNNKGWCLKEGIKDDFYKTGYVPTLESMDLRGDEYCYVRKGKELARSFPELAERNIPVVFIVEMKS